MYQANCVAVPLCIRPIVYQAHCARLIVYQAHCVTGPLYPKPIVSQAQVEKTWCLKLLCPESHVKQFVCLCVITVNIHIRTKWVTVILKVL